MRQIGLLDNSNPCSAKKVEGMNWGLTFGSILDSVWRARNDVVFNNASINFHGIFHRALDLANCSSKARALFHSINPLLRNCSNVPLIKWDSRPPGFIKLNMDAAVCDAGFKVGCGGIARNQAGDFLYGFSRNLQACSVLEGELWAIFF